MAVSARIIGFYGRIEPDHRGRYVHEIQRWSDDQLERVHDYIQWLFPLPEPSAFNLAAPVLNGESIEEFRTRPDLQENLRVSFFRMMNFYGLEVRGGEQITVRLAPNVATKAAKVTGTTARVNQLSHGGHRITSWVCARTHLGSRSRVPIIRQ